MADNLHEMNAPGLPTVFQFLADEPNRAVEGAIIEALRDLDPAGQRAAVDILLDRGDTQALATLIGLVATCGPAVESPLLSCAGRLSASLRAAMSSDSVEQRAGAIHLIVKSRSYQLAYLLSDALRQPCDRTRALSARGLQLLTQTWPKQTEAAPREGYAETTDDTGRHLGEALSAAVRRWDLHGQRDALRAAMWMADRTEAAFLATVRKRRSKLPAAISTVLGDSPEPRLAGFVLRALAHAELRPIAGKAIRGATRPAFWEAMLREPWLMADPAVAQGCRSIRWGAWVDAALSKVMESEGSSAVGGVRFLLAVGLPPDRRDGVLGALLDSGSDEIRLAVVRDLAGDTSDRSTSLLAIVASRRGGRPGHGNAAAAMAAREVRLRRESSSDRLDRVRRLGDMHEIGRVDGRADVIRQLAHDPDATVRSMAVGGLSAIGDLDAVRVLRARVNDSDARVQANAVEALDRLDRPDRVAVTRTKLHSPDNRVRANAVRSLLRAQVPAAAETLMAMLDDRSAAHRLSGLWVVEDLGLRGAHDGVDRLAAGDPDPRVRRRARRLAGLLAGGSAARPSGSVEPEGEMAGMASLRSPSTGGRRLNE